MDVADLDRAVLECDPQVGTESGGAAGFVEEGEEERILAGGVFLQALAPLFHAGWRVGGQVGKAGNAGTGAQRFVESLGVQTGVERFDMRVAAAKAAALRKRAWLPVRHRTAQGL